MARAVGQWDFVKVLSHRLAALALRVYIYVVFKPEICRLARAGRLPSSTVAEDAGP